MEYTFLNIYSVGLVAIRNGGKIEGSLGLILVGISVLAGYLLGSLNSAVILSRVMYHEDIRDYGSGNAGATNMMRRYGKNAALLTLGLDMLKAAVSVWIAILLLGVDYAYIAGLACVLGHCFPLYFHFKGGKGVAVAAAVCLFANPIVFLILLLVFVIVVSFTKYISLGSIMGLLMFPLLINSYYKILNHYAAPIEVLLPSLVIAVLIIVQHRENIKRLREGDENKFSFKKSEKTPKQRAKDAHREEKEDQKQ